MKTKIRYWRAGDDRPDGVPRRHTDSRGYVRLRWTTGPYQQIEAWEHIWVAGKPGMDVHHLNGDHADNTPGNLLAVTPEEHRAIHAAQNRVNDLRVIALYQAGLSTPKVGEVTGCDASTVSRALARNGIPARRQAWNRKQLDEEPIITRLNQGDRVDAIARDLDLSRVVVDRVRREAGLPPRRAGNPNLGRRASFP